VRRGRTSLVEIATGNNTTPILTSFKNTVETGQGFTEDSKPLNPAIFVALMGTSALAISTELIFDNVASHTFATLLELSVISIFIYFFALFLFQLLTSHTGLIEELIHPLKSNMYPGIPIAAALIAIMLAKIGLPYLHQGDSILASAFWAISLFFAVVFVVVIPINIKFRSKLDHVVGTWFIPPVGLFVLASAGAVLGIRLPSLAYTISFINLVLLGPAFVLYFLTLSMLYFRTVFHKMPDHPLTPTFNIVLAPVGVSIMAVLLTSKLMQSADFFGLAETFAGIAKLYSIVMFGYGLWVLLGLSALYRRMVKERGSIPFSEIWWAFVFPLGAFVLASSTYTSPSQFCSSEQYASRCTS